MAFARLHSRSGKVLLLAWLSAAGSFCLASTSDYRLDRPFKDFITAAADDPHAFSKWAEELMKKGPQSQAEKDWLKLFSGYVLSLFQLNRTEDISARRQAIQQAAERARELQEWDYYFAFFEGLLLVDQQLGSEKIDDDYQRLIQEALTSKSYHWYLTLHADYAVYLSHAGEGQKAMEAMQKITAFMNSRKDQIDPEDQAVFFTAMAYVMIDQGFPEKAIPYYKDSLIFFDTGRYRISSSITHYNIADLYLKLEGPKSKSALAHFQNAARQASSIEDHVTVAASKIMMTEILAADGRDHEAERLALEAFRETQSIDNLWSAKGLIAAGHSATRLGHWDVAEQRLKQAKKLLSSTDRREHRSIHQYLSEIYEHQGHFREALEHHRTASAIAIELQKANSDEQYSKQRVRLALDLEEQKNKSLRQQQELQKQALEVQAFQIENQKRTNLLQLAVLLAIGLFTLALLYGYFRIKAQKHKIEELNTFIRTQVLKRFLPPDLVAAFLEGHLKLDAEAKSRIVTVLFADLCSFTQISERLPPEHTARILNMFFIEMTHVVFHHGGTIDKFIGDAVMVIYGAPTGMEPDEQGKRAVACAKDMMGALDRLNQRWLEDDHVQFKMRIGIHQGPAVAGSFGSELRSDYTVVGSTVNIAARIEGQASPAQILVTSAITRLLPQETYQSLGPFMLRGVEQPVELFELRAAEDLAQSA